MVEGGFGAEDKTRRINGEDAVIKGGKGWAERIGKKPKQCLT